MRKDFTQPFERLPTTVYLLTEDLVNGGFLTERSPDPSEDSFVNVLTTRIDEAKGDIAIALAAFLHETGLVLVTMRELVRETELTYSFIDDTPGTLLDNVCVYVGVDVVHARPNTSWVTPSELLLRLQDAPFSNNSLEIGIATLVTEREIMDS